MIRIISPHLLRQTRHFLMSSQRSSMLNFTYSRFLFSDKKPQAPKPSKPKRNLSRILSILRSSYKLYSDKEKPPPPTQAEKNKILDDMETKFKQFPMSKQEQLIGICIILFLFILLFPKKSQTKTEQIIAQKTSKITSMWAQISQIQMIKILKQNSKITSAQLVRTSTVSLGSESGTKNITVFRISIIDPSGLGVMMRQCSVDNIKAFLQEIEEANPKLVVRFTYAGKMRKPVLLNHEKTVAVLLLIGFLYMMFRFFRKNSPGISNLSDVLTNKKFQAIRPENINTKFKDVAGMHEAKAEITEFVDFLKQPDRYIKMGARIPKGALLTGPPGTGKTLIARACAGEAGVPFFYVSGSDFIEKYVGLGANRIRSLFEAAAKSAPSIVFIDQIDAIGKKRNSGPFSNEERNNTLNQLLVSMDGFDTSGKIIVMAATNLLDSLDPALLRPGRFDRTLEISLPNFEERQQILKVHLDKVLFSKTYTIDKLAHRLSILTPGFSGAELANICNEAAILAARKNIQEIQFEQFEKATERVIAGLQKRNLFTDEQRQKLAYYECGKAVSAWFTKAASPVIKLSILPYSKSSQGYSHSLKEEVSLMTKAEILAKATCLLAGRAAEKHFCGQITSNGEKDLAGAKRLLVLLVTKFGMGKSLEMRAFPDSQYTRRVCSNHTQHTIDREIEEFKDMCQNHATELIINHAELIEKLKERLLKTDRLSHADIKEVLGERPFKDASNYNKYLREEENQAQNSAQAVNL